MILLILISTFLLRVINLNQSLWLDEAIGAIAIKNYSFLGIFDFVKGDNHPPLYYLVLKIWADIFGYTEVSLRMLSVIFGIGTVIVLYLIAKKLSAGKLVPIISTIFLATSPLHIYYSQEARMYAMAGFLAALATYSFLEILANKSRFYWTLFSLSITALVFTDYVPIFLLPVFWIIGLTKKTDKGWWIRFVLSHLPLIVFGLLWLSIFTTQAKGGNWLLATLPSWRVVAGGATIKELILVWTKFVLGRISLTNKALYYSLLGLASIPFIVSIALFLRSERKYRIVWTWLLIPLVLAFIASFFIPAFTYFRFIFVLPAFYLLVSLGIAQIKREKFRLVLASLIVIVNFAGWGIYALDKNQQREMWRQATSFVETNAKKGDIIVFDYPEPFAPYRWYANGTVETAGVANSISADTTLTSNKTKEAIKDKNGVYYFEYLIDLTDPQRIVEKTLTQEGFTISKVYGDFVGVGQIKYFVR